MFISRFTFVLITIALLTLVHSEQGAASTGNGAGPSIGGPAGGTSDGVTDVKARKRVGDGVVDPFGA